MKSDFDFTNLFVLDMANNHQGKLEHGLRIIREMGATVRANGVRAALKFQFRQLDSFIHPSHQPTTDNKQIVRFLSTRLSRRDFATMTEEVRRQGLTTIATPFDEGSVDMLEDLGIEVLKIASCSANDWPLLERVAESNKPVIFSTGGLTLKEIDDVVSFFSHRRVHFAIMHCVSIYPTPFQDLQLNQIATLRRRYPERTIGFSTHEDPKDIAPVFVAVAKGASMLERHVGVEADGITLNAYSSTPALLDAWIKAAVKARVMCGATERPPAPAEEMSGLDALRRGVYACHVLEKGRALDRGDVYLAMPWQEGQLHAGQWQAGMLLLEQVEKDAPFLARVVESAKSQEREALYTVIHTIKAMLNEAGIALPTDFQVEFSHHYGIERFSEVGATIITCVNRSYCKKLIVQMPGQRHPPHYHKRKEETFQVLHGILEMTVEGRRRTLYPGDTQLVQQGVWHEFWTETGACVEEISTTHFNDDSFYEDKAINKVERSARKTFVSQWGRNQL